MKPSAIFAIFALSASSFSQVPAETQLEGPLGPLSYSGGQALAFAPDHTMWATGLDRLYERDNKDFNVLLTAQESSKLTHVRATRWRIHN